MATTPKDSQDSLSRQKLDIDEIQIGAGLDLDSPESYFRGFAIRTSHVLAVALIASVFVVMNFMPLWHTDTWAHLKSGQLICENLKLPDGNPFAPLLEEPIPSNHYCWFSQVLIFQIFQLGEYVALLTNTSSLRGGIDALRFFLAFLVALRLALLITTYWKVGSSWRMAILSTLGIVVLYGANMAIFRPQMIGETFFVVLMFLLSSTRNKRLPFFIAALLVLWANTHGSYAIGLVLLTLVILGKLLDLAWAEKNWRVWQLIRHEEVAPLVTSWLASVLGVAVLNPAGPWIYLRTIRMAQHPVVLLMDEWQPLQFHLGSGGHWGYLLTVLAMVAGIIYARRLPNAAGIILLLFFGLQPLRYQRGMVWFLMIVPWVVLPLLQGKFQSCSVPSVRKSAVAVLLCVIAFLWSIPGQWIVSGEPAPQTRSLSQGTPWQIADVLEGKEVDSNKDLAKLSQWLSKNFPSSGRYAGRIFTSETSGDYILYSLPDDCPVFMYSHVHLFTKNYWDRFSAVRFGTPFCRKVLDHYKIDLIVVEAELNPKLRAKLYLDRDWEIVLDETGEKKITDYRNRLLVAIRKVPMMTNNNEIQEKD